jgi:FKBP-type peptidyl-prolyl cis-trans isomerase FklB
VKNKKEGEAFLAKNKEREGVVTLPSGLQYEVVKNGEGPKPSDADRVKVHYKGTLIDGTTFDSSYKRNKPAVFPVRGVIKGWTEALKLMSVGSKWKIYVPAALAYGKERRGPDISPNSTLIFEMELLGIEPPAPKKLRMPTPKK